MAKQLVLSNKAAIAAGALYTYLRPRIAMDHKTIDVKACLLPMRGGRTFKDAKGEIANAVRAVAKGRLAMDADIDDVANLLDAIESVVDEPAASIPEGLGEENGELEIKDVDDDGDPEIVRDDSMPELLAKVREFIKDKVDEETLAQFDQLVGGGVEPAPAPEPEDIDTDLDDDDDQYGRDKRMGKDNLKPAMDERIKSAIDKERRNQRAIFAAVNHVRSVTGELAAMKEMAFDSAEDVFAAGCKHLGVKLDDIHPTAYKAVFDAKAEARAAQQVRRPAAANSGGRLHMATDALPEGVKPLSERLPGLNRVKIMG